MTYDINSSYLILFQTIAKSVNDIEMTQKRHTNDILMT